MIDIKEMVKLSLELLPMSRLGEQEYHDLIDEIKKMTLTLEKFIGCTAGERIDKWLSEYDKISEDYEKLTRKLV